MSWSKITPHIRLVLVISISLFSYLSVFNWIKHIHRQIELDVPASVQLRYLLQMMCRIMNA